MKSRAILRRLRRLGVGATFITAAVTGAALWAPAGYGQAVIAMPGRYDLQPDTARDRSTGLTWQRMIPADQMSFAAAGQYCADLILGNRDDWRVPSMQEFQTIVDEDRVRPAIDGEAFPGTPAQGFWSATPWAETPQLAWHVDFDTGSAAYERATELYWVRCVRWDADVAAAAR